ncbi:MAG: hypothetical protein HQ512_05065 [Rhodospirillales bacterium]|nr:hypothetical protein [Rhodospirillales bacterium]
MFGFSIQKLLFTVAVITAVWYGYKWLGRMKEIRDRDAKAKLRRERQGNGGASASAAQAAEDMVECPTCGAFVAASGAKSCGKDNCPYTG